MKSVAIVAAVRCWVEEVVVGLNLCPFARAELIEDRVRFFVSEATDEQQLLTDLQTELERLESDDSVETTLLIHPQVLTDFDDYNQFLDLADRLLEELDFEGVCQIASFHPDYQFAGTQPGDAQNYTNRAPYPVLHLLREASLERAIASFTDVELIPERNIELLEGLGQEKMQALLRACFTDSEK
ncbi:MAG: DUF1415 domain-containing protein [Gammaproteobacteria bacterium]|nr:MAG: DUF1415 domain-containing protein [Gammaproteobacteria bacterium]RLA15454.1 MAG: DUF1415 domain-containing protein [Gammaproteobacteria bacterium]RLA17119.1 MAG: DUF1415 domain-containing protein [Gammaproteobacteria bacterium]